MAHNKKKGRKNYEKYAPREEEERPGNRKLEPRPSTDNISPAQIVYCTTEFYTDCSSGEMVKTEALLEATGQDKLNEDHSYRHNFCSCGKKTWKSIKGLYEIWTLDLCNTGAGLY